MPRATLGNELQTLRGFLPTLLPILTAQADWYASIYVEKKSATRCMANLRQTDISDTVSMGLVFRIYDGYTLHESATDNLDSGALETTARRFAERVLAGRHPTTAVRRNYRAVSWSDRLQSAHEPEITSQLPSTLAAGTEVHFGITVTEDPFAESIQSRLDRLKALVARCLSLAPEHGLAADDLTYVMARQGLVAEESLFIDSEVNMSQALVRISLALITMAGVERTNTQIGGLGGLEAIAHDDALIGELLADLAALKKSTRIAPGKYRVLVSPGIAGVVAHEAFGHSQEGDTCARGRSKAWDLFQSGTQVGNTQATILNNPAIFKNGADGYAAWGSYYFDEEGWLAQEQILLDAGVLKAPMTNLTSAIRLGVPRTANGKRESWSNGVYTRQTNTYFSAGQATFAELMTQMKDGFLATHVAGGMEDPKGMGIQVGIQYLKEVKDGKLTGRVFKGPAGGDIQMTGYTPDVLQSIVAKSKVEFASESVDEARHPFNEVGGCGKYHKEIVSAGCGGPYILFDQLSLG